MKKLATITVCTFAMLFTFNSAISAQCGAVGDFPMAFNENIPVSINCVVPNVANITDVTLTLEMTHTFSGDLDFNLTNDGTGTNAHIIDSICGGDDIAAVPFTLTDAGGEAVSDCGDYPGAGGNFTTAPDDIGAVFDTESGLAELGGTGQGIAQFKGSNSLAGWTIDIVDNFGGDSGQILVQPILRVVGTLLPVELVSFEGTLDDDVVNLSWITATENNNTGFEIEHKVGYGDFQSVGFVEGAGTTQEEQNYAFQVTDVDLGNQVFRLKQIDFDGTFVYSSEIEITRELADGYLLKNAYPNPFNPQTTFSLLIAGDQQVDIGVYNLMGQRVQTIYEGILAGQKWHQMTFQSGSLSSGSYLIRSVGPSFINTQQVVLMK